MIFAIKASVFLAASVPIYFSDAYTTIIWVLMGSGVSAIGLHQQQWKWRLYSSILFTLAIGNFIFTDLWTDIPYGIPLGMNTDNWLINTRTITGLLISLTLWITYIFYQRNSRSLELGLSSETLNFPKNGNPHTNFTKLIQNTTTLLADKFSTYELWRPMILGLSGTIILWITMLVHIANSPSEEQFKAIMVTIITATYGTLIVVISVWKNNAFFRILGTILVFLASVLSVTLVSIQPELPPNMWISATFFSFIFMTILMLANMILQNAFYIWPETSFKQINFISKFAAKYTQEVYSHLLGINTFIAIAYELSYQWNKVGISFYRLEDLAFTFLMSLYGFVIFTVSYRYLKNLYYSKLSFQLLGLILFGIASVKFLTLDMIVANNASILYEWDGFLWLKGFAFIPFLNPYFLLAFSLLSFGVYILRTTVSTEKIYIYNWKFFSATPFIAFSLGAIILVQEPEK